MQLISTNIEIVVRTSVPGKATVYTTRPAVVYHHPDRPSAELEQAADQYHICKAMRQHGHHAYLRLTAQYADGATHRFVTGAVRHFFEHGFDFLNAYAESLADFVADHGDPNDPFDEVTFPPAEETEYDLPAVPAARPYNIYDNSATAINDELVAEGIAASEAIYRQQEDEYLKRQRLQAIEYDRYKFGAQYTGK